MLRATPAVIRLFNAARAVYESAPVDELVRNESAFQDLNALVQNSLRTGYRPTLHTLPDSRGREEMYRAARCERIADAFDAAMHAAGSDIRAYRDTDFEVPRNICRCTNYDHRVNHRCTTAPLCAGYGTRHGTIVAVAVPRGPHSGEILTVRWDSRSIVNLHENDLSVLSG